MTPNTPNEVPDIGPEAEGKSPDVRVDTESVTNDVQALLAFEGVTEAADIKMLTEASSFLNAPTENVADIARNASNVAEVMAGFEMQGEDPPEQIDAMHGQLLVLLCKSHIATAKGASEMEKSRALVLALDVANVLAKGYKNDSLLKEVEALMA
ncbi:MAG: hypothetical protein KBD00_04555 [Candidatus Peribacteraceae bacterium]|nr:hypothetical protein [Candidatus Peribacteraceae bacterium]